MYTPFKTGQIEVIGPKDAQYSETMRKQFSDFFNVFVQQNFNFYVSGTFFDQKIRRKIEFAPIYLKLRYAYASEDYKKIKKNIDNFFLGICISYIRDIISCKQEIFFLPIYISFRQQLVLIFSTNMSHYGVKSMIH